METLTATKQKVIIIGAGPSGLLTLKHLKEEPQFEVTVFDAKKQLGGVWLFSDINEENHPNLNNDAFFKHYGAMHSSLYEEMQVDIPKILMTFKGFPMQTEFPGFPYAYQFLQYLQAYASHFGLESHLRLDTFVEQTLLTKNLTSDEIKTLQQYYLASQSQSQPQVQSQATTEQ